MPMLLNKIPVLDKGYVALISSVNATDVMVDIKDEFFAGELLNKDDSNILSEMANMTLAIKCPLFVQLNLAKFGLKILTTRDSKVEAYVPNETEILAPDLQTNRVIASNMFRTSEALLINPLAFQKDGCDRFISQILSPISVYNTLVVHGTLNQWVKFCEQDKLPRPIEAYRSVVTDMVTVVWKFV
jgi:hypothetical protein